ncbi:MAG: hypothetical protein NWF00_00625 [Candidatus Bathyarchaeota archaeon]|nr:hypothetical protein [Candidatus Bathyarchaeota archaeon]
MADFTVQPAFPWISWGDGTCGWESAAVTFPAFLCLFQPFLAVGYAQIKREIKKTAQNGRFKKVGGIPKNAAKNAETPQTLLFAKNHATTKANPQPKPATSQPRNMPKSKLVSSGCEHSRY